MSFEALVGAGIDLQKLRTLARKVMENLTWFGLMRSPDPKKQAAIDKLHEVRIQASELFDIVAPGWEKEG